MISTLVDPTTGCVLVDDSGDTRFIHTSNDVRVQKRAIRALLKTRPHGKLLITNIRGQRTLVYVVSPLDQLACEMRPMRSTMKGFSSLKHLLHSKALIRPGLGVALISAAAGIVGFASYKFYRSNQKLNKLRSQFDLQEKEAIDLKLKLAILDANHKMDTRKNPSLEKMESQKAEAALIRAAEMTAEKRANLVALELLNKMFFTRRKFHAAGMWLQHSEVFKALATSRSDFRFHGFLTVDFESENGKFTVFKNRELLGTTLTDSLLLRCKDNCFIVLLKDTKSEYGHAVAVFLMATESGTTVYHFDPLQSGVEVSVSIMSSLLPNVNNNLKYIGNSYHPQSTDHLDKEIDPQGYCLAWSVFAMAWAVRNPQFDLSDPKLYEDTMKEQVSANSVDFIRKFALVISDSQTNDIMFTTRTAFIDAADMITRNQIIPEETVVFALAFCFEHTLATNNALPIYERLLSEIGDAEIAKMYTGKIINVANVHVSYLVQLESGAAQTNDTGVKMLTRYLKGEKR